VRLHIHRWLGAGLAATLAVSLAACAGSDRGNESSGSSTAAAGSDASSAGSAAGGPSDPNGQIVFGAAGAPSMFDPMYATDGETFRVVRQMNEGLTGFKPGTADVEPALAKSWEKSSDGLTWTFTLQDGVKFHDGTPFDAAAVCYNLDRMYAQTGAGITQGQYWSDNMGGFKGQKDAKGKPVPSLYGSCKASDAGAAAITLTRVTSKFPALLGLPSFSMQSPTALKQYDANNVKAEGDSFIYPAYATDHPTGTGPFKFQAYDKANNTVTLVRNDDYWGEKAKSKTLIFKIIPDETARKQELEAGTIDGYDLPNPADWDGLKSSGFNLEIRPAFNILYLGFTLKNPDLQDLRVRQAIAYALNRPQLVSSQLPEGAVVASLFYPDTVTPYTQGVQAYDYNVQKAKDLLAAAGKSNLTLNFWWPTDVTRPYMPDPKSIFTAFKSDLQAAGITIKETSKPWNGGYLDGVEAQQADIFLLGWTGDYNTPDNFLGSFFSDTTNRFATSNVPWGTKLSGELQTADSTVDDTQRNALYDTINKELLADYLPGVPISSSSPALVLASNVQGMVASPLTDEKFAPVYKN
jgi:peptide/nickel transport system substrate-binding protein